MPDWRLMLPAIVKFVMKLLPGGFTFPNSSFNEFSPLRTRGFAVFQALGIQTEEYFLKNFLETEVKAKRFSIITITSWLSQSSSAELPDPDKSVSIFITQWTGSVVC